MGTTRIKVIDLSSSKQQIKTKGKHAEKLAPPAGAKVEKETKEKAEGPELVEWTEGSEQTRRTEAKPKLPPKEIIEEKTPPKKETPQQLVPQPPSEKAGEQPPKTLPKKQAHHLGKKYRRAKEAIEKDAYPLTEALALLPKTAVAKFNPSVDVHLNVADKNVKAQVTFPHSVGVKKEKRYLVFGSKAEIGDKQIIWADEKTVEEIEAGKLKPGKNFDVVIASAKFMPALARVAKILGPRGMMPNPKNGTITENPKAYLGAQSTSQTEFTTDPTFPIIHAKIGKLQDNPKHIEENLKALISAVGPTKIKKTTITTTMGPGIKIDLTTPGT